MAKTLPAIHKSVREISQIEEEALRARTPGERFADMVVNRSGRMWVIVFHGENASAIALSRLALRPRRGTPDQR